MNASGFPRPGSAGTRSTGKPSRMAQVGEWAEADPDALLLFFVSTMPCAPPLLGRLVALQAGATGLNWRLSLSSDQEQREEKLPVSFLP